VQIRPSMARQALKHYLDALTSATISANHRRAKGLTHDG
jgi:hypothetical protein